MADPMWQAKHFTSDYAYVEVADAGHFLHRERPDKVNKLTLDWFARG